MKSSWAETLASIVLHLQKAEITHLLLVQADDEAICMAALVPVTELRSIWEQQRKVSVEMIASGQMGRVKKNHAENGDSPTLWLKDDRYPGGKPVAEVLWGWPGVADVMKFVAADDDTYDDLGADPYLYGSDGAGKKKTVRSQVKRDLQVRRAVIGRATNGCERPGCSDQRAYKGFLDVHHILGAEKSDRVWTCVAVCPNCHREAHHAPDAEEINASLLAYARRFQRPLEKQGS